MLPILKDGINTIDPTQGEMYGELLCTRCVVVEERNGNFDLEAEVLANNEYFNYIIPGNIILVELPDTYRVEGSILDRTFRYEHFRIYKVERVIDKILVYAHHISYDLSWKPVEMFSTSSNNLRTALNILGSNIINSGFHLSGNDATSSQSFKYVGPASARKYLGGMQGSILDVFGGEWEWNNLTCILRRQRGKDNGIVIEDGINMTDFNYAIDNDNCYTGIYGYVIMPDGTMVKAIVNRNDDGSNIQTNATRLFVKDFSEDYQDAEQPPTQQELISKINSYLNANTPNTPNVSLQTAYYLSSDSNFYSPRAYAIGTRALYKFPIENIFLCDFVWVVFKQYKLAVKLEVVKVEYDVLAGRNIAIELNQPRQTLADTIANLRIETNKLETNR